MVESDSKKKDLNIVRCLSPRTVGFQDDGKTLSWSQKYYSKEYATFQLPCGKCLECRLEYARSWAIRCMHEAQMYEQNSFITLTYSDENLKSDKLQYIDFQLFTKRLRKKIFIDAKKQGYDPEEKKISIFVTGEYGDKRKRPHWHALIFNWRPTDCIYKYSNERGDRVFDSQTLTDLWGLGICEVGSVTFESAGYCARYAAKKLVHGRDDEHDFQPISKKSSKNAIGKKWLEKYWQDVFNYGQVILITDERVLKMPIPRYYEKWLQKNHPQEWIRYVTKVKTERMALAQTKKELEIKLTNDTNDLRPIGKGHEVSRQKVKTKIIEQKFKQLTKFLKGDI